MTGRELLAKLQALPPELLDCEVYSDGCDCTGPAEDLEVIEPVMSVGGRHELLVTRA